jgi:hypothetical protein
MADYFTHFSCVLDVVTARNAARALELYKNTPADDDGFSLSDGFLLSLNGESGSQLWIYDDPTGNPERVIEFVLLCAEQFDLKGLWGFEWAHTCSRPRIGAFGGGALLIDLATGETLGTISSNEWLTRVLADPDTAGEA